MIPLRSAGFCRTPAGVRWHDVIAQLEEEGLVYYDDFFELSGNWPDWLRLFAMDARA